MKNEYERKREAGRGGMDGGGCQTYLNQFALMSSPNLSETMSKTASPERRAAALEREEWDMTSASAVTMR